MSVPDIAQIVDEAAGRGGSVAPQGFEAAGRVGGTQYGAFLAHPADKGAGVLVLGYDAPLPDQDLGIEVAVVDDGATVASTGAVEEAAMDAINMLPGYRAVRVGEGLAIETAAGVAFDPEMAAGIIAAWLTRTASPERFAVRVIFGPPGGRSVVLRDLRRQAYDAHAERRDAADRSRLPR